MIVSLYEVVRHLNLATRPSATAGEPIAKNSIRFALLLLFERQQSLEQYLRVGRLWVECDDLAEQQLRF